MAIHNKLGEEGEKLATAYLQQKGYRIRHTNWRSGHLELDIVAESHDTLYVIEVKTRSTAYFEHPKDAITNAKIKRIVHATEEYIHRYDIRKDIQFDIMALLPNKHGTFDIEHIPDAFLAPLS